MFKKQNPIDWKKFSFFHFSYMRFIDKTDFKLSVSDGSFIVLSTSSIKTIFLLALDFAAESSRCRGMISTYYRIRMAINSDESCKIFRVCAGRFVIT